MFKKIIAGLAAIFSVSAAAHAADLGGSFKDGPAPAAAYAPIWAGLYVGGSVGFGVGDTSGKLKDFGHDEEDVPARRAERAVGSLLSSEYDVNGAIYGAHIGYNWQYGSTVFGVEGSINGTDMDGSEQVGVLGLVTSERELDWYATAVGRLGYAAGNTLFYGFGGVAWGTVETTLSIPLFGASVSGESEHVGWTAGIGIEYALNERFSVRAEYSHVDLGEETASLDGLRDEVDMQFDAIKIGASYRLGGGENLLDSLK